MNNEAKVGAFTLTGAAILAGMISFMGVVDFGSKGYDLVIHYNDAQGLLNGAQVRYAGVPVGSVKDIQVVNDKARVVVKIKDEIKLPRGAEFTVGSDGVMGDKYVAVMPPKMAIQGYLDQGSQVEGKTGAGMDEFFQQSAALMEKIKVIVANIDDMLTNDIMRKSLQDGAQNLEKVTENLRGITENLKNVTGVINGVSQEPETANALRQTIYNVRDTSANAKALTQNARSIKFHLEADAGHNMQGGHWRGNLGASISPNKKDFLYVGGYDIGGKNKIDFIAGTKLGRAGLSLGAMQGEFGLGLSYQVGKRVKLYSQLYDFNNAKLRLGGEVAVTKHLSVYGETMDIRHGTKQETYAGVRARF